MPQQGHRASLLPDVLVPCSILSGHPEPKLSTVALAPAPQELALDTDDD